MKRNIVCGAGAVILSLAFSLHAVAAARFERFTYEGKSQEGSKAGAGEYVNPILSGYYPDPSVTRVGEDYYLINSSFAHFPGIPVFHSKDLVNWTQIGNAIDRPSQLNFDGLTVSRGVFAPDISYHDGLFYIVNTCVDCRGNFVITAKDARGPWSDPAWFEFDGIDPSIFWEGDKAYIVNNGVPNEPPRYDGHRAIWVQEFDYKQLRMVGERTQIVNGGVDLAKKPVWIEGPHLLKRGDYYYLIAAEGGTADNHSQVVFRSKSVRGPFVPYERNPILSQRDLDPKRSNPVTSAGHAKFVQTQNGEWWATFLATRPYGPDLYNIGRETFMLPVTWENDWPTVLGAGKRIPFVAAKPKLPEQSRVAQPTSGDFSYVEEFDGSKLSLAWLGIRTPRQPIYSLQGGALVLHPAAALGDVKGVPAFIGHRQQHHIATVSTTLTYKPEKEGGRAGLVALQNDNAWLFFGVTRIENKPVIALFTRQNPGGEALLASAPLAGDSVTLTMSADGGTASFAYQAGGKTETLKSGVDVTFLSTRKAGGFVGTVIGPYAYEAANTDPIAMRVNAGEAGKPISRDLMGVFFEDLNHAGDGGLYAELVQNRSFEFNATEQPTWNNLSFWTLTPLDGAKGSMRVGDSTPLHPNNPHYAVLEVMEPVGAGVTLSNNGFQGISLRAGERYDLSFFARHLYFGRRWSERIEGALPLVARLESPKGEVLAETKFVVADREWQRLAATLTPSRSEPQARLVILATVPGGMALDEVSLFPQKTFRGRPNGLRADLAQTIADLKPRFLRFPGGCIVHGHGLGNMYRWQETVGPIEQRRQQKNLWGYHQSVGLGYFEFFQFAEDIGAKPVPVVPAGVCCQNADHQGGTGQRGLPIESMSDYVQEVLDLIEYANGPVTTKWGAMRAAAGHPEPFGLKYLGVGNEDHITFLFKKRFEMIHAAVKAKHPEITVIGTVGPFHSGDDFEQGWQIANELSIPIVDEHYYVSPQWFWDNLKRYDSYDRAKSKVYLGEYAAHDEKRRTTLRAALAEAAHLTTLERNADVVLMASYAPLLGREGLTNWNPNLIYFDGNGGVYPTVSYEVQKLFGHHAGDRYLSTSLSNEPPRFAVSSVRDTSSGAVILKLVNGGDAPRALRIQLDGANRLASKAKLIVLSGQPDDVNDYETGRLLEPKTTSIAVGASFAYTAPANSLSIVRVKQRT